MEEPIDLELKRYKILSEISKIENEWKAGNYINPTKKLSRMLEDLKIFATTNKLTEQSLMNLTEKEINTYNKYKNLSKNGDQFSDIFEIIVECHDIIINKIREGRNIIENLDKAMRIFSLTPDLSGSNNGILVISNTISNDFDLYTWGKTKINPEKTGLILKKVDNDLTKNEISYNNIIEDLLASNHKKDPHIIIIEIENLHGLSNDLVTIAKNKFSDYLVEEK